MSDTGGKSISPSLMFEGQFGHLIWVIVLVAGVFAFSGVPGFAPGRFLGISTAGWVALAVAEGIVHQVYVWYCWRSELHGGWMRRTFGASAFNVYATGFTILFVLRPLIAFAAGWANRGTLPLSPIVGYAVSVLLLLPVLYMMYSVVHYFSFRRAFGIDHFDPSFRNAPLVRQGIFKWTPNAMYVFGFFMMWIPVFLFQSVAAVAVALFSHAYIWVHYVYTERPDMRRIYGPRD